MYINILVYTHTTLDELLIRLLEADEMHTALAADIAVHVCMYMCI